MTSLTKTEKQALLILFKDFTNFYNANSISKVLGISHVGAQKIFKKLLNEDLLISKKIGKSIIYKLKLNDDYVIKLISFLLVDEANGLKRWKEEFKELFKKDRIILIYGSAIKNYAKASDIDLMLIIKKSEYEGVAKVIEKKQEILPKKVHSIELTINDFLQNIKKEKKSIVDIVKNAIVLCGQDKYVNIIKNVAGF